MLIRSEDGIIYNLDHAFKIELDGTEPNFIVVAYFGAEVSSGAFGQASGMVRLTQPKAKAEAEAVLDCIIHHADGNLDLRPLPADRTRQAS